MTNATSSAPSIAGSSHGGIHRISSGSRIVRIIAASTAPAIGQRVFRDDRLVRRRWLLVRRRLVRRCVGHGRPGNVSSVMTEIVSTITPTATSPYRAIRTRKCPLMPTRNSTVAR